MIWRRIFLGFFCLTGLGSVHAATATAERGEPAVIDARELNFDRPNNLAFGSGDVVIRYRDAVLRADKTKFNTATKEIWAEGNVRLNRQGQEWVSPAIYYNFDTREVKADDVRGFVDPVFVRGYGLTQVATNQYHATRATATTCDALEPHYRIQASRAEIFPGDRVTMFNCTVWVGDVPVFWFPVMAWSLTGDPQPVTVTIGQSSRWGFYALTTAHWKVNKNWAVDVHVDERTQRGLAGGLDVRYRFEDDVTGLLRSYYVNDDAPRDGDDKSAGRSLPTHRYLGEWQHKQLFTNDVSLTVDLNRQSDPDVYDDFFSSEFRRNNEPGSVADVTKRGENYTVSALVRPQFNSFFAEVERLPEVKWAVNRVRAGRLPVFYESETSAGYYSNHDGRTADPVFTGSSVRFDSWQQLTAPATFWEWFNVVPRAAGRYTYYTRAPDTATETQEVARLLANLGMEASFKLSRTWPDAQIKRLGIDGLRHIVQPFADYSWIPTPDVPANELFQFDTVRSVTLGTGETFPVTRYVPLGFPGFNEVDAIDRENTVRFGLRQRLQTRRNGVPWDLLELTGWTEFHVEQDDGAQDFANLFGTLRARPTDWFALNTFARYDLHGAVLRELNTEARVSNGDQWAVGVGTRFLEDDSNLVSGSVTYRLLRNWVAQVYQRFDMQDGQWEEQEYLLRQETHDWYINYGFRYRSERTKSDEKAVFVSVTLKAFPGVSLGVNRVDLGSGD